MRILMVNKYYRLLGGVERYISELTQLLEQRGHEVIPFSMSDPLNDPTAYAEYFVSHIDFLAGGRSAPWKVAERVIYSREARQKIAQLVKDTRPDVAHLHNIYHYISPSVLHALRRLEVPILMTLHDYKLVCPAYKFWANGQVCERCQGGHFYQCVLHRCSHGSLPASLLSAVEAYTHRLIHVYDTVDLFISPSRFLREKHIAHGLDPERIVHVPNLLSLNNYTPCFGHENYFAYVGRLTPFKGIDTLLEAVSRIRPDLPLLIAGDGPSAQPLKAKAASLGLKQVRFLGHQSGDMLKNLIAQAMFVVVPSEWYENSPYAVLEAFALGTPVIGTTIGGIPESVKDGVNGVLVPPRNPQALAEGLSKLLDPGAPLAEMGHAGREYVERVHDSERHLHTLSRIYSRLGIAEASWESDK